MRTNFCKLQEILAQKFRQIFSMKISLNTVHVYTQHTYIYSLLNVDSMLYIYNKRDTNVLPKCHSLLVSVHKYIKICRILLFKILCLAPYPTTCICLHGGQRTLQTSTSHKPKKAGRLWLVGSMTSAPNEKKVHIHLFSTRLPILELPVLTDPSLC